MKVFITVQGEESVGIPPLETEMDIGFMPKENEIEHIRKHLEECFSAIYQRLVIIDFEDERNDFLVDDKVMFEQHGGM